MRVLIAMAGLAVVAAGCGRLSGVIQRHGSGLASLAEPDFLKTEIVDSGAVPADGASGLVIGIHLKNSDNSPVPSYQPSYEVSAGSGVTTQPCTTSDLNGISACALKATQAGIKRLRLTNARIGLVHDVVFEEPHRKGQGMELVVASAQHLSTNDGYRAQLTLGSTVKGIQVSTSGGYKGKISLQGVLLPE